MALTRRIPEDVLEYYIFPLISEDFNDEQLFEYLEGQKDIYLAHLSHLLVDYIWQNETFNLKPAISGSVSLPPHLHGSINFGDNVEDEWFVVYLLCQLTKDFSGLLVRVYDNDQEFLLIEAADVLPKWLNPETAENRVFLYDGDIHIIPIPESSEDTDGLPLFTPTIPEAIDCIRQLSHRTRADDTIQKAVKRRIECFPAKTANDLHFAHCFLPAGLAAVLEQRPSLLAAGVNAFYYRSPDDLKVCRTFKYFRPGTRVMSRVKFTKCLYAQLVQQKFQPHRESGWVLPNSSNSKFKSHDLGMKLAHGFEILCSKASQQTNPKNGTVDNFDIHNIRWERFLSSLSNNGYFKGELQSSKYHTELLQKAQQYFNDNVQNSYSLENEEIGSLVVSLLEKTPFSIEEMRLKEINLPPPDDDSWLDVSPADVDEMIRKSGGKISATSPISFDMSQMTESMKSFVDNVSDYEGAEFPKDCTEGDVGFDSTGFIHAMQEMFEFEDAESGSSSEMDEYGWNSSDEEVPIKPKPKSEMKNYLEKMDKELSKTEMAKSFEKKNKPPRPPPPKISGKTSKRVPPARPPPPKLTPQSSKDVDIDIDDEDEGFRPVNIDANLVKNMLASYGAQQGLPGPATNILSSMGIQLKSESKVTDRNGSK